MQRAHRLLYGSEFAPDTQWYQLTVLFLDKIIEFVIMS